MLTESTIYNMFRQMLKQQLRIRKKDEIHVSEVVQCLRKAYYYRKYGDPLTLSHLSDTKCVILGLGICTHMGLQSLFQQMRFQTEKEVRVKVHTKLGSFDFIGTIDLYRSDMIVELKTVNKIPERPYEHHLRQVICYQAMCSGTSGEILPAYIVYICKRDGRVKIFQVKYEADVYSEMLERAVRLYMCLRKDVLPEPERSHLCKYCEFQFRCSEDELELDPA